MPVLTREPRDGTDLPTGPEASESLAVADPPTRLPDAGVVRDARVRQGRRRRRTIAGALLGIVLVGAAAAGLAGSSGSGSTGHASPERLVGLKGRFASAAQRCRSRLPRAAELAPGAPHRVAPLPPALSLGFWHTVLVDRQGPTTAIVFESATRRAHFECFIGRIPKSGMLAGGYGTRPPAPVAADTVALMGSGGYRTPPAEGSELFSWIVGRAGTGVSAVTVRFADGGHVVARSTGGWFLAWWRGRRPLALTDAIAAEVALGHDLSARSDRRARGPRRPRPA
jgi:hypothetical protein